MMNDDMSTKAPCRPTHHASVDHLMPLETSNMAQDVPRSPFPERSSHSEHVHYVLTPQLFYYLPSPRRGVCCAERYEHGGAPPVMSIAVIKAEMTSLAGR